MESIIALIIPFIVLVIFGSMVDQMTIFLEELMKPIPKLPNELSSKLAFIILVGLGFSVCWEFDYNLFAYLYHPGRHPYSGYLFTAIVISGGSSYIKKNFESIDSIPTGIQTVTTTILKMFSRK